MTTVLTEERRVYLVQVFDGDTLLGEYRFGIEPPVGVTVDDYKAACQREAELLAAVMPR